MKLVVDLRLINASGIGTYLKNVFPALIPHFEHVVVLGSKDEILKFPWADTVEVIEFASKIYYFFEQIEYVYRIPKCDIFWCPHFNAPLLPIKAKKIVVTIHDVNHLAKEEDFSFVVKLWAKILYRNASKKAAAILTVSNFSITEISKHLHIGNEKIHLVYGGVNEELFLNLETKNFNLALPEKYLLYVGNVKPHKNLITLLQAYAMLDIKIRTEYKLVILGKQEGFITGDLKINDFIDNNGLRDYIHFTGYVKDDWVPHVYKESYVFVMPSLYEGFGLPVLEAMASGVPVLCSNSTSLPEVGGDAAVYFNPHDFMDLHLKLVRMLNNKPLRDELIVKGRDQVKKFSWKKSISNHLKVFNSLK